MPSCEKVDAAHAVGRGRRLNMMPTSMYLQITTAVMVQRK